MKRYLVSLLFVATASTAWAQNLVQVVVAPQTETLIPVSTAGTVYGLTGVAAPAVTGHGGHCEGGKCSKKDTVCVPVPDKITKTKVLFSSDCEVKCHKGIFSFLKKGADCGSCPDGKCGHAHVERYLYKRVQTETCDSFKCVPTQCPAACASDRCVPASAVVSGQPAVSKAAEQFLSIPPRAIDSATAPTAINSVPAAAPRP